MQEPRLITVTAPIWLWSEGKGSWHFLTIPADAAVEIRLESTAIRRGFGSVRVEARINGVAWRTSIFPQKDGGYLLPVKAEIRRRAGIAAGDEVAVELELV
jgi:hypothetical protein